MSSMSLMYYCILALQPEVIGSLTNLLELWADMNRLTSVPKVVSLRFSLLSVIVINYFYQSLLSTIVVGYC